MAQESTNPTPTLLEVPPDFESMSEAQQNVILDGMIDRLAQEQGIEVIEDDQAQPEPFITR